MHHWLGVAQWHMLLRRTVLAILHHIYVFISNERDNELQSVPSRVLTKVHTAAVLSTSSAGPRLILAGSVA